MKRIIHKFLKKKKSTVLIGVLALQGNFKEHADMLARLGIDSVMVKLPSDLNNVHGLIIPGGESTTLRKLMHAYRLDKEIIKRNKEGMPVFGTCAGAIMLAKEIVNDKSSTLGLIDIAVERNAYGRQNESFEAQIEVKGIGAIEGIFIRSPTIEQVHNCSVLASYHHKPIMVRQNTVLVTTFHPELTANMKIHEYFLGMVEEYINVRNMQLELEN